MFQKRATAATNSGEKTPANVPQLRKFSNKRREFSGKCSKKTTKTTTNAGEKTPANVPKNHQNARALCARYETRVGSPPDFQLKRASAPSCLRALNRSAQAGRRANAGK